MADASQTARKPPVQFLYLEPGDEAVLWGILGDYKLCRTSERWPRLERILSDLEAMMDKQEAIHG